MCIKIKEKFEFPYPTIINIETDNIYFHIKGLKIIKSIYRNEKRYAFSKSKSIIYVFIRNFRIIEHDSTFKIRASIEINIENRS